MTKLIVTSDWHLDWTTAGVDRFDELTAAVERIVVEAKEKEVDGFLFLGDLCDPDSPRAWRAVSFAIRVAHDLDSSGIDALWLVGNHDVVEDGHGTSTLSPLRGAGVRVVDTPCSTVLADHEVVALPFTPRSHAYDPAEFVLNGRSEFVGPSPRLVLGHLCIEGIEPGSETKDMARGREVFLPLEEIQRELPGALVFNGHYHRRQTFREVHVPGSLARLTRGERDNSPGYLMVEV
jgi:DNA repair exonuclease SbcCD nuclease subunit